jgi:hypothetical protein
MASVNVYDRDRLSEYLLGALPAAEAEALDELSITDDEMAACLEAVENDLVDEYVRGELKGKRLEQFQAHYLASQRRRERVAFARSLSAATNRSTKAATPGTAWRYALAAAAVLLVFAGIALLVQNAQLRRERDEAIARLRDRSKAAPESASQSPPAIPDSPVILALHLAPPVRGGEQAPALTVPRNIDLVSAELELEANGHSRFVVSLKRLGEATVLWRSAPLQAQGKDPERKLAVLLRANLLQTGTHVMEVASATGSETVGTYSFRVIRE